MARLESWTVLDLSSEREISRLAALTPCLVARLDFFYCETCNTLSLEER